jgi:hypothetical protein
MIRRGLDDQPWDRMECAQPQPDTPSSPRSRQADGRARHGGSPSVLTCTPSCVEGRLLPLRWPRRYPSAPKVSSSNDQLLHCSASQTSVRSTASIPPTCPSIANAGCSAVPSQARAAPQNSAARRRDPADAEVLSALIVPLVSFLTLRPQAVMRQRPAIGRPAWGI